MLGRLALAVGVVIVAAAVLYVGVGGLSAVAKTLGSTLSGFVQGVTATPSPRPTQLVVSDAPSVDAPGEPYTNQGQVDLVVTVPRAVVGDPAYKLRIYLALAGQSPTFVSEVPIGATARTVVPVQLTKGINNFVVTIVGPAGESDKSPVVLYVLDQSPPGIKVTTPKDGATVNGTAVDIKGRSQARTTLIARNAANGATATSTAAPDGTFDLNIALASGSNRIHIVGTDPAGNVANLDLTLKRGGGKLTASVSLSAYSIPRSSLPIRLRVVANVVDPDGNALANAQVTFTVSIPGIPTVSGSGTTDANGRAQYQMTIPRGAGTGIGNAAILVKTKSFGNTTDQTVVTITK